MTDTPFLPAVELVRAAPALPARPWPRHLLPAAGWRALVESLAADPIELLALWADTAHVHALLLHDLAEPVLASVAVEEGRYPALSPSRPGAAWFERMIRDLWGFEAIGGMDGRPWLDHGRWPRRRPMSVRPLPAGGAPQPPEFRAVEASVPRQTGTAGLVGGLVADGACEAHQVPFGPVGAAQAGLEGPAHLRVAVRGETIVQAEVLLGYGHRGVMVQMRGKPLPAAMRLAARLAGTPVAHAAAFGRAAEAALGVAPPPRGAALRALALELERVAVHFGELEAVAAGVGAPCATAFGVARETVLRACDAAFGQRLMLDVVVPGGAIDLLPNGPGVLRATLGRLQAGLPSLVRRCDGLLRRAAGRGVVSARQASQLGAGGVPGRASGRGFDARLLSGAVAPASREAGDAAARIGLRLEEVSASLDLAAALLAGMPAGALACVLPAAGGEGLGVAEGARGDCWAWLSLDAGLVASVFLRDPGWALWPLLEEALRGEPMEAVGLIARSMGCEAAGVDL